jgi:hypothetical protein
VRGRTIRAGALVLSGVLALAVVLLAFPAFAAAGGNDVAQNLGTLARKYAGEVYGGIVANRRYTELGLFFIAAILVAWLVFSPDQIANAARAIGQQVLP